MILGPGGTGLGKIYVFFHKKMSKKKLEFILRVEVEVEVGVFSYQVEVEVEVEVDVNVWEGAQAAQNTLGPSYLVE